MGNTRKILVSELRNMIPTLKIGDKILLTGYIFTARDAAHKRFFSLISENKPLPIDIKDSVIYYAGPTPASPSRVIGSCGPTTSGRMDRFAPQLLDMGVCGMIGKGERDVHVREAIVRNNGVYLCAVGGAGVLIAECVRSCEVVAFEDLGCESVKRLYVESMPLIVADDVFGQDIFELGKKQYRELV